MSGPNIFSRKPKLWIGAGIAVIATVLVARYFDFPPQMGTQGTIAPAKRFVAEQPGAGDVNGGQSDPSRSVPPGSTDDAAHDAASNSVKDAASNSVKDAASNSVRDAARNDAAARSQDARQQ